MLTNCNSFNSYCVKCESVYVYNKSSIGKPYMVAIYSVTYLLFASVLLIILDYFQN